MQMYSRLFRAPNNPTINNSLALAREWFENHMLERLEESYDCYIAKRRH